LSVPVGGRALPRIVLVELADGGGAVALARALRDEGVEVVHAGRLTSPAQVLSTVEQEDPDALGVVYGDAADLSKLAALLAESLPELRVFGWRDSPDAVIPPVAEGAPRAFENALEVTDWLAGGRTHTPEEPSDRIR
jgi:methylmalonyl-CoA mutase, C-terminal domain